MRALLNTRQGSSALDPEYGLPDFTDLVLSFPEGGGQICAAIASLIERYEPRLSDVRVEMVENAQRNDPLLRFVIYAMFVEGGGTLSLRSSITPNGRVALG